MNRLICWWFGHHYANGVCLLCRKRNRIPRAQAKTGGER